MAHRNSVLCDTFRDLRTVVGSEVVQPVALLVFFEKQLLGGFGLSHQCLINTNSTDLLK